uniref:Uncharacterized protein n=1 Tax=uncultured prokaryote TaxID=198431 RepID=A0A0H5Q7I6_9ZZZZ|nr:hypothetical protein [uncultured prokaryote]
MAQSDDGARITISGGLGSGEIWASSFWLTDVAADSQSDFNDVVAAVATAFTANARSVLLSQMSSVSSVANLTGRYYAAGESSYKYETIIGSVAAGGTGSFNTANQVAMVLSLRTADAGRSKRGRMYLPANSIGTTTTNQFQATYCATVANDFADFFSAVNAITAGGGGIVAVASGMLGTAQTVTSVQVDTRPDVQRRRANKMGGIVTETADVDTA